MAGSSCWRVNRRMSKCLLPDMEDAYLPSLQRLTRYRHTDTQLERQSAKEDCRFEQPNVSSVARSMAHSKRYACLQACYWRISLTILHRIGWKQTQSKSSTSTIIYPRVGHSISPCPLLDHICHAKVMSNEIDLKKKLNSLMSSNEEQCKELSQLIINENEQLFHDIKKAKKMEQVIRELSKSLA